MGTAPVITVAPNPGTPRGHVGGPAPGFLGVYQVSLRLPSQARGPTMLLACGVAYTSEFTDEVSTATDSASLPVQGP
jgi:hypothetical protein